MTIGTDQQAAATLPQYLSQLAQPWAKPNPVDTPVTSQQADPIAQRQAAQTTPPPKASNNLSNEDLAALTESWRHLAEAGDPRADKLRAYIGQQANSILHPEQQADPTGVIKKGWDWLNKGLISRDTMVGAISGMTPDQLDRAMSSFAGETPTHAAIREFTRGAIQDIGTLGSSFTSPLSVATIGGGAVLSEVPAAISTAPGTIGAIVRGARAAQGVAAGGFALQGANQALQPGMANTPEAWGTRLAGAGQAFMGMYGSLKSAPGVFNTGKEIATSLSHPIESARSVVQAAAEPVILRGSPEEILTRAIKPTSSNTGWDDAIKTAMPDLKAAETDLGHPIESIDDALQAVNIAKKKVWSEYSDQLDRANAVGAGPSRPGDLDVRILVDLDPEAAQNTGQLDTANAVDAGTRVPTIDGNQIADAMMNSIDKRQATLDPGLTDRVKAAADTYRRPMPLDEAEDFLQSANNELQSYYAKNKVGRRAAQGDPSTASTVAEADALRDSLYSKIQELTGEDPTNPKNRYGALSNIEAELLRRKNVAARQQPMSLQEQIAGPAAAGKIVGGALRLPTNPPEGFSMMREGATRLVVSKALKDIMTTDNMVKNAFKNYQAPKPTGPGVNGASGPSLPARIGAGAARILKGTRGEGGLPGTVNEDDDVAKRAQEMKSQGIAERRTAQDTKADVNRAVGGDPQMAALEAARIGRASEAQRLYPVKEGSLAPEPEAPTSAKATLGNFSPFSDRSAYGGYYDKYGKVAEEPNAPTFYSKAEQAAEKLPGSATGQQMYNTLVNAGVKPAELEYSGAKDWLNSQGKVTRQQVQDYLKQNGVKLGEKTYTNGQLNVDKLGQAIGQLKRFSGEDGAYRASETAKDIKEGLDSGKSFLNAAGDSGLNSEESRLMREWSETHGNKEGTKYQSYVEPGPKANYAEKLITLPDKNLPEEGAAQFQSDHWDEPNVLAHARYDDRTLADGKKALFVEEAQSDWHQQGKKEGYFGEGLSPEETAEMTQLSDIPRYFLTEEQIDRLNELTWKGSGRANAVPDAPFKSDWHELVMKRMLREAAERGADKLAWTTGDQQAERYDLSKRVAGVSLDSHGNLYTLDHDGHLDKVASDFPVEKLADYIGKDAAQKLISAIPNSNGVRAVNGLDLKIGGEWAKALYDRAIPNFMNKYLKKYGVRVGTSEIPIEKANPPQKVHSIDLTPQMKRDLLKKGQPIASDKTFDAQGEQTA